MNMTRYAKAPHDSSPNLKKAFFLLFVGVATLVRLYGNAFLSQNVLNKNIRAPFQRTGRRLLQRTRPLGTTTALDGEEEGRPVADVGRSLSAEEQRRRRPQVKAGSENDSETKTSSSSQGKVYETHVGNMDRAPMPWERQQQQQLPTNDKRRTEVMLIPGKTDTRNNEGAQLETLSWRAKIEIPVQRVILKKMAKAGSGTLWQLFMREKSMVLRNALTRKPLTKQERDVRLLGFAERETLLPPGSGRIEGVSSHRKEEEDQEEESLKRSLDNSLKGDDDPAETSFVVASVRNPCNYLLSLWSYYSVEQGDGFVAASKGEVSFKTAWKHFERKNSKEKPLSASLDPEVFKEWVYKTPGCDSINAKEENIRFATSRLANCYGYPEFTECNKGYRGRPTEKQLSALKSADLSFVDCMIKTEHLAADVEACLRLLEKRGEGYFTVDWEAFKRFGSSGSSSGEKKAEGSSSEEEEDDAPKATHKNYLYAPPEKKAEEKLPPGVNLHHGKCEDMFDEKMKAFVMKEEAAAFEKFGYAQCCE